MRSRLVVGADVSRGRIPRNIRPRPSETAHVVTLLALAGGYYRLRSAQHPSPPDQERIHKHPLTGNCRQNSGCPLASLSSRRPPRATSFR